MVFATEFDPFEPSPSRQSRRSASDRLTSAQSSQANSVTTPANHPDADAPESVQPNELRRQSDSSMNNVVPLNFGGEAKRVTVDPETRALVLPDKPSLPVGLRLLNRVQQGSTVLTSVLVTGALLVYGSTVYLDKSTNRALAQLDALQGESQELTSANESIKQSLAEQAIREDSGLKPTEPGDVLFLAPMPRRASEALPEDLAVEMPRPLGY
ncbi:MAG: hypothetical protein AAGB19_00055 [Cyanobacteria bacterium P01_F01_bin.3]